MIRYVFGFLVALGLALFSPLYVANGPGWVAADHQLAREALIAPASETPDRQVATTRIVYVNSLAPGPVHDGLSWETAYINIQDALASVRSGSDVWVARGVYFPDVGVGQEKGNQDSTFRLQDGVALYGGFTGTETRREERSWVTNLTVLSGDIDANDLVDSLGMVFDADSIKGKNAYNVVTAQSVSASAVLDGFVVTAGQATGVRYPQFHGGGVVVCDKSSVTLANITLTGNTAISGTNNGLYWSEDSSPNLTNVALGEPKTVPAGADAPFSPYDDTDCFWQNKVRPPGKGMAV